MDAREFKATLQMLVPMVVSAIVRRSGLSDDEVIPRLYASRLYADLEREETKLWHLSPWALADLWDEEQRTGRISYPEEA